MKKFITSIGVVAVGTASLQAAYAPGLSTMETSKLWTLSATLRGFYDDNYTTAPSGAKLSSFGFVIKPSIGFNLPMDQTLLTMRYTYGFFYYQDRQDRGQKPYDQTHQFDLSLDHAFNERWNIKVADSFVSSQEPDLVSGGVTARTKGNNINNSGSATLNTAWTELFSTALGYRNTYIDYSQSGGTAAAPSYSGLLDRDENLISLDFQWHATEETMLFVGYQYGQASYIGGEPIATFGGVVFNSSSRDTRSHYGYLGVQHTFLSNLKGSARGGVQSVDYYNDPNSSSTYSPYVDVSLTYNYNEDSYAQVGFNHSRNGTDVIAPAGGKITLDQETSALYGSINHHLTPKLLASAIGRIQYSTFNGGAANSQAETTFSPGVDFTYSFNEHFSAEVGYSYDKLNSDVAGRNYARNRVYIGLTATY
jgi:hypothetical protein